MCIENGVNLDYKRVWYNIYTANGEPLHQVEGNPVLSLEYISNKCVTVIRKEKLRDIVTEWSAPHPKG